MSPLKPAAPLLVRTEQGLGEIERQRQRESQAAQKVLSCKIKLVGRDLSPAANHTMNNNQTLPNLYKYTTIDPPNQYHCLLSLLCFHLFLPSLYPATSGGIMDAPSARNFARETWALYGVGVLTICLR